MIGVSCLEKTWPTLITCEGRCRSFVSWRYDVSLRVLDGITRFRSLQRGQLLAGPGSEVCFGGYWWSLTSSEQVLWKLPPKPGYYHSLARQPVLPGFVSNFMLGIRLHVNIFLSCCSQAARLRLHLETYQHSVSYKIIHPDSSPVTYYDEGASIPWLYRDQLKSVLHVWWILLLLLFITASNQKLLVRMSFFCLSHCAVLVRCAQSPVPAAAACRQQLRMIFTWSLLAFTFRLTNENSSYETAGETSNSFYSQTCSEEAGRISVEMQDIRQAMSLKNTTTAKAGFYALGADTDPTSPLVWNIKNPRSWSFRSSVS